MVGWFVFVVNFVQLLSLQLLAGCNEIDMFKHQVRFSRTLKTKGYIMYILVSYSNIDGFCFFFYCHTWSYNMLEYLKKSK